MSNIKNSVVIVSDASSRIGEVATKKVGFRGATVVPAAWRKDPLKKLQSQSQASGGQAIYKVTDVVAANKWKNLLYMLLKNFDK